MKQDILEKENKELWKLIRDFLEKVKELPGKEKAEMLAIAETGHTRIKKALGL